MHKTLRAGSLALAVALLAAPAFAQTIKLINPNVATEAELTKVPGLSAAIVKNLIAARPFKSELDLHKFYADQKLTEDQVKEIVKVAFIPVNINTGTKDELLLIPGVGARMAFELNEYRPWKNWAQFDKEIGKYVGQGETDRLKSYLTPPG
ncbi:MAG: helix-hairpin-helix domain-containing protein [Bauldia sp.]